MARLYNVQTGSLIGTITTAQLHFLTDQLEEEDSEDRDYYIDHATLDWFQEQAADPALLNMLRAALGTREGMDVRWDED